MAVDTINRASRIPLPDDLPSSGPPRTAVSLSELERPTQVEDEPQTPPIAPASENGKGDRAEEARNSTHVEDCNAVQGDHIDESDSEDGATDDAELPPFDWNDLHQRMLKDMEQITGKENDIMDEFQNVADSFSTWAGAGAQRDNERANKRIRTRERYVQLAEDTLENKRKHYTQVVDAFKNALDLLSQQR